MAMAARNWLTAGVYLVGLWSRLAERAPLDGARKHNARYSSGH
ncbi:hypothetical protein OKW28_005394 [Paraburkholderia sp. 40]